MIQFEIVQVETGWVLWPYSEGHRHRMSNIRACGPDPVELAQMVHAFVTREAARLAPMPDPLAVPPVPPPPPPEPGR